MHAIKLSSGRPNTIRLLQFSLRSVMAMVAVVGVMIHFGGGWIARERSKSVLSRVATDYDYDWLIDPSGFVSFEGQPIGDTELGTFRWYLENHPHLTALHLNRTRITDAGLRHLLRLRNLRFLDLSETAVTDEGRRWLLERMPDLRIEK